MAHSTIKLCYELYKELLELAKKELASEYELGAAHLMSDHKFWNAHFDTFRKSVKEKCALAGRSVGFDLTNPLYYYGRLMAFKRQEKNKKVGRMAYSPVSFTPEYLNLLLIQCGIEDFEAIFSSGKIDPSAKESQMNDPKCTQPQSSLPNSVLLSPFERMLGNYEDTNWWLYFHDFLRHKVLGRLKLRFRRRTGDKYPVEVQNYQGHSDYEGIIRTDVSSPNILIAELQTKNAGLKFLHLKFVIYPEVPEIILGTYSNYENSRLICGSVILHRAGDDFATTQLIEHELNSKTIKDLNIPPIIPEVLKSPQNNSVKMPSENIKTLDQLEKWKNNKGEPDSKN
ncbi:hypothetical protein [Owenweeksia hongkongensis]|uniref:hypothetical protein n=1 Tax=Owenweeksia hongkongensis TaxID=253245 RepID=UPI003A8D4C76